MRRFGGSSELFYYFFNIPYLVYINVYEEVKTLTQHLVQPLCLLPKITNNLIFNLKT